MSVLDEMVNNSHALKEKAALTPVGTEKRIPDTVFFLGQEELERVVRQMRESAATLMREADEIESAIGKTPEQKSAEAAVLDEKLAEREADRRAADREAAAAGDKRAAKRVEVADSTVDGGEDPGYTPEKFKAQQAAAQAAVYGDASAPEPERVVAASGSAKQGWVCPDHGDSDLKQKTSPAGRTFTFCKTCKKVER